MNDMQKLLYSLQTIQNKENQENVFQAVLTELQYLLFRIQLCPTALDAHEFFDTLEEVQLVLAKLNNRHQVKLPSLLLRFVIDFSDVYDQNARGNLFENIKKNKYVYGDMVSAFSKVLNDIKEGILQPRLIEEQKQLISKNIQDLLYLIAAEKQLSDADIYFEKLLAIQELLSKITFVYGISLNKPLMQFIYDCERLDDIRTRIDLFQRIKQGEYNIFSNEV